MKILFVHQNFPGQYLHLARSFADQPEHQVLAIGKKQNLGRLRHPRVREIGYDEPDGAGQQTHHYLRQLEAAVRQGQNAVRIAQSLRRSRFEPDIVCCHPGWGEGLYLRDVGRGRRCSTFSSSTITPPATTPVSIRSFRSRWTRSAERALATRCTCSA